MYACVYVCVCVYVWQHRVFFAYKSRTDDRILIIIAHMTDINEMLKLTKDQDHKVKVKVKVKYASL